MISTLVSEWTRASRHPVEDSAASCCGGLAHSCRSRSAGATSGSGGTKGSGTKHSRAPTPVSAPGSALGSHRCVALLSVPCGGSDAMRTRSLKVGPGGTKGWSRSPVARPMTAALGSARKRSTVAARGREIRLQNVALEEPPWQPDRNLPKLVRSGSGLVPASKFREDPGTGNKPQRR